MVRGTSKHKQRGQGMTEYIIIVALVAIGAIAVVSIFGDNIRALFGTSANALTGSHERVDGKTVTNETTERDFTNFSDEAER